MKGKGEGYGVWLLKCVCVVTWLVGVMCVLYVDGFWVVGMCVSDMCDGNCACEMCGNTFIR